jgi:putative phosphoesterase
MRPFFTNVQRASSLSGVNSPRTWSFLQAQWPSSGFKAIIALELVPMKLLILSDIHGNWPALEAVVRAEHDHDAVAFCGDIVDYGPHPVECLHWVAEHAEYRVRGNHDNALGFDVDCRCMGSCRDYSTATRSWHRSLLSEAERRFLRRLPTISWFEWNGRHFRMAHATPQGDLFEYLTVDQWGERVKELDCDVVVLGHTHIQGMRTFGKLTVVNPGSVGLARDGGGEACYAVYDGGDIELRRVPYEVGRTIRDLRAAPLAKHVIAGLEAVLRPPYVDELSCDKGTSME